MSTVRVWGIAIFVTILIVAFAIVIFTKPANAASNIGATTDAMCVSICTAAQNQNPPKPCPTQTHVICQTLTVTGVCMIDGCKATAAGGVNGSGNSLSSMSQLLGTVGNLLGKLIQGQSPTTATTPTGTTATGCTSYTPTSDPTQVGVNPCVYYVPSAASQITTGTTGTTGNTSAQDLLNSLTGTSGSSGTTSGTISASPNSGAAPLSVTFTTSPIDSSQTYEIDPGDGSGAQAAASSGCSSTTSATCVYGLSYTYTAAGTYTAILEDSLGDQISTASVSVVNPGGSTTAAGSGLSQVFNSVGGLFAGSSTAGLSEQTSPNFPGVLGNILLDSNGATIYAATVNSANNSETSGFYGSDTVGSQPQGVASSMCEGRPWASNFLANIIPPSFFDSLCQWGGYQVGQPQPAQTTQPQVTLTQQQTSPAPAQTTPAATTTAPTVPAQAVIWAVPASVPLGTRTSIFWNTQGVTQCTETSPDGSFNESSLSGAAATVPLTGSTTYTISCLDSNGNPITDYVTVNLSS